MNVYNHSNENNPIGNTQTYIFVCFIFPFFSVQLIFQTVQYFIFIFTPEKTFQCNILACDINQWDLPLNSFKDVVRSLLLYFFTSQFSISFCTRKYATVIGRVYYSGFLQKRKIEITIRKVLTIFLSTSERKVLIWNPKALLKREKYPTLVYFMHNAYSFILEKKKLVFVVKSLWRKIRMVDG